MLLRFESCQSYWSSIRSDEDAEYDDELVIDGSTIEPMVTWGINPGQGIGVSQPFTMQMTQMIQQQQQEAFEFMGLKAESQSVDIHFH